MISELFFEKTMGYMTACIYFYLLLDVVIIGLLLGEEPADLVDCRTGLIMPQVPSKAFWGGFDDIHCKI